MTVHGSEHALLRLAWSARPERIESCRQQSNEELARLPAHMRQPVVCEGAPAEYRLSVSYGGRVVAERLVRAGGLRQDRSLYVFHEVPLDTGDAAIEVRFDRLGPDAPPGASVESRNEMAQQGNGGPPAATRRSGPPAPVIPAASAHPATRSDSRHVLPERRALVAVDEPRSVSGRGTRSYKTTTDPHRRFVERSRRERSSDGVRYPATRSATACASVMQSGRPTPLNPLALTNRPGSVERRRSIAAIRSRCPTSSWGIASGRRYTRASVGNPGFPADPKIVLRPVDQGAV